MRFEQLELELRRSLYRDSFADFTVWAWPLITGAPLRPNRATTAITAALQDVADGRTRRLLVAVPPGLGKTTTLALYAAWRLLRNPGWRAIHASHSFSLISTQSRRVRRLVESAEYQALFPAVAIRPDESSVENWATTADGRFIATGTDSGLTGRRADEAVLDDPLAASDRFSKAARESLWSWFTESLSTRLDGENPPIACVQQRLDQDDLIGRLITAGGWTLLELPAEDDDGTLLAPEILSREKLDALKLQIGSAVYACQFLQRPSDDSTALIKRGSWRFHRPAHVAENTPRPAGCDTDMPAIGTPERFDQIVIGVDMTFGSTKATADYCAACVWGSVGAARYLLGMYRARATQLEQQAAIKRLSTEYPGAAILVERAAAGVGTVEQLTAAGMDNVIGVPTGNRSKAERLALVSPAIEAGNCFLPLGAPWLSDFTEELSGATRSDDVQDATAYSLAYLNTHSGLAAAVAYVGIHFVDTSFGGASFGGTVASDDDVTHVKIQGRPWLS